MPQHGGFSNVILNQILAETAERVCKQIHRAKIYFKDSEGLVLFDDEVGRVASGENKIKVIYIPRQYRRLQTVTAEVHYFDADNNPLMWTRIGPVGNGDILHFVVTRPEDCHYER